MAIGEWFNTFCDNLRIPTEKRSSISTRYELITQRLNSEYRSLDSKTSYSRYVGSYGRETAIDNFSDLDMIYQLPYEVYERINNHQGNGQSALLQEVKNHIKKTYSTTDVGGDGQVVVINFSDGISFEIVPAFINKDGSFTYPDSNNGGKWKVTNPIPEIGEISKLDKQINGNLKSLCRMVRAWKDQNNVPIGGLLIDTLAHKFISDYQYKDKSYLYYDYMSRDFLKYLSEQNKEQAYWLAIGSSQRIDRIGLFEAKAKKSYEVSLEAIEKQEKYEATSKSKWREIYGPKFPS